MLGMAFWDFWLSSMGKPSTMMIGTITALYDFGAFLFWRNQRSIYS
jgi:hypothetical protein